MRTAAPASTFAPLWTFTFGDIKRTVAPFFTVVPFPTVIDVAAVQSHAVPAGNVTFVRTTGSPVH
jgi:hypothetical protein